MKKDLFRPIIALGFAVLAIGSAQAQSFNYASVDFPSAIRTRAWGISPGGIIVGDYLDSSHLLHGFLLAGGQYITLDVPGSVIGLTGTLQTSLRAISPTGDIVGFYFAPPDPATACTVALSPPCIKGFLLHEGNFSTVLFPGHEGSIPQRITANGNIYGCYHDVDLMGTMFGFTRTTSGFSAITVSASMHTGATPDGSMIVGLYTDMMATPPVTHAYTLRNGNFHSFDVPNSMLTQAWDINLRNTIVGDFKDSNGTFHGFLRRGDVYRSIDFPAATGSHAFGINPGGATVGTYTDVNGLTHGFLAVAK